MKRRLAQRSSTFAHFPPGLAGADPTGDSPLASITSARATENENVAGCGTGETDVLEPDPIHRVNQRRQVAKPGVCIQLRELARQSVLEGQTMFTHLPGQPMRIQLS